MGIRPMVQADGYRIILSGSGLSVNGGNDRSGPGGGGCARAAGRVPPASESRGGGGSGVRGGGVEKGGGVGTGGRGGSVEGGRAESAGDGGECVGEDGGVGGKEGAVYAGGYITLDGKADLLELQVAGADRVQSADGTLNGNAYSAAPQGDAQSGRYTLAYLAVERADTYLFIGEKDRVFLGTALIIENQSEAK